MITHAEVCRRHGVGALLEKILAGEPESVVLYSHSLFDGESAGSVALHLPQPIDDPSAARRRLEDAIGDHRISRILCVPHFPDEAESALAAAELTGAPLVTYVMDDRNLFVDGIPNRLMKRLVDRSAVCFAISPVLQAGYREKFETPFWIIPPVNERSLFAPPGFAGPGNSEPRGVLIGNLWSEQVLDDLRLLVRDSRLRLDWYGNAGKPFIEVDPEALRADGIVLHPELTDEPLAHALRRFDYGIMPTGTLSGSSLDWLFRASLPSRLIHMLTSAHLPLIVIGSGRTAAGRFVSRLELGTTVPYEAPRFVDAVERLTAGPERRAIRERAAALSPAFASEPVFEWVWRSAELGRAADDRYETLLGSGHPGEADRR